MLILTPSSLASLLLVFLTLALTTSDATTSGDPSAHPSTCSPLPKVNLHNHATLPYLRFKWPSPNLSTSSNSVEVEVLNLPESLHDHATVCYTIDYQPNIHPPPLPDDPMLKPPCVPIASPAVSHEASTYLPSALTVTAAILPMLSPESATQVTITADLVIHGKSTAAKPASKETVTFVYVSASDDSITIEEGGRDDSQRPPSALALAYKASVRAAFDDALNLSSNIPAALLSLPGMSGRSFRHFLSSLVSRVPTAAYLEIGVWAGSSFLSAIAANDNLKVAIAIDNWSQYGGPKEAFIDNVGSHASARNVVVIENDCWKPQTLADLASVTTDVGTTVDVYFFDGPHEIQDHYRSLVDYFPLLSGTSILVVDDWNFVDVRVGTLAALDVLPVGVVYEKYVYTKKNVAVDETEWHNGMAVFVLEKH
jgi:hypothetical protein